MKQNIEVIVSPIGEVQINAIGFKGSDCEQATKYLEEALGVVGNRVKKPEYHQQARKMNQQRIGSS
jgi:hypothetical protein